MDFIRFCITRPVTVSVGVLLILLFGLIAFGAIPIQLTPNIETTVVSVTTRWEGATPQQIETDIVLEQEERLKGIPALTKMISIARQGESAITLEFAPGTTKEGALREVSDKLREVPSYPENVDEPIVEATNPADRDYIAWVVFSSTDPNYDIKHLQDFIEDRVKPEFERVPGVAEINVIGGYEREVHVRVDPHAMASRGITPTELTAALRAQNRDASAGEVSEGKLDVRIRSVGRYDRLSQIEDTLLSMPGEPVVRVKDIGEAVMSYKRPDRSVRNKGRNVIAMNAQREVGSNVIEVMEGFQERLAYVDSVVLPAEAKRLGLSGPIAITQVYDQTIYIYQALDLVKNNLWIGGVLATIVLFLFLRSVTSTLIIAMAIPISVIGTFVAMVVMGRSLNVISLAGLAFATGMVMDNAIVVLENIDRHRRLGEGAASAAYRATKEVWGAVLASTLTTLFVFIPIVLMQQEAGQLFRDISLAICASVALSMLISITVIPTAAARWLRGAKAQPTIGAKRSKLSRYNPLAVAVAGISGLVGRLNRTWALRLGVIAFMTVASVILSYLLMPPLSYLPSGNRNLVFGMLLAPPGYNLEQQESIGDRIQEKLRPYWEANGDPEAVKRLPEITSFDMVAQRPIQVKPPALENFFFVATPDTMFMGGISSESQNVKPVEHLMNWAISDLPGVRGFAAQLPLFRTTSGFGGDALDIEISGFDLDEVTRVADMLLQRYSQRQTFGRVTPDPANFNIPGVELVVERNPVHATDLGVSQADLNTAVQIFGDGAIIGDYLDQGDAIDLKVISTAGEHNDVSYLRQVPLATPAGRVVPLDSVAEIRRTVAPQQINRVKEQRSVKLSITLPQEIPLEQAIADIEAEIAELREQGAIPPTVETTPAGSAAKLSEVREGLLGTWKGFDFGPGSVLRSSMFIALLITFLLMAALFESWVYPLVILFTVPLATVGGFLGLRIVHTFIPTQQLDVLTMLGFVILIGIVVNNAILIVHQALNLIHGVAEVEVEGQVPQKLPPHEAIVESVRSRVRPIFMTTMTSVGGMLPLVLFPGAGSELYRGLGAVVLGGLIVSTMFTLILVPLTLGVAFDLRKLVTGEAAKTAAEPEPAA